jgi:hypothetical protein
MITIVRSKKLTRQVVNPILVSFCVVLTACSEGSNSDVCGELNSSIDRNIVEIAVSAADGDTSDKSAMQQSARLAAINNRLSTVMINLQLQAQYKCSPRQQPIDPAIYSSQALECYGARLKLILESYGSDADKKASAKTTVSSACDFKAWNAKNTGGQAQ